MATRQERIAKRRADMPSIFRGTYDRSMSGKSRAAGVKAFCVECMGWSYKDTADCNTVECPLHPYNPYVFRLDPTESTSTERQSTNGLPVALDSQKATQSQNTPVTGLCRKETSPVA